VLVALSLWACGSADGDVVEADLTRCGGAPALLVDPVWGFCLSEAASGFRLSTTECEAGALACLIGPGSLSLHVHAARSAGVPALQRLEMMRTQLIQTAGARQALRGEEVAEGIVRPYIVMHIGETGRGRVIKHLATDMGEMAYDVFGYAPISFGHGALLPAFEAFQAIPGGTGESAVRSREIGADYRLVDGYYIDFGVPIRWSPPPGGTWRARARLPDREAAVSARLLVTELSSGVTTRVYASEGGSADLGAAHDALLESYGACRLVDRFDQELPAGTAVTSHLACSGGQVGALRATTLMGSGWIIDMLTTGLDLAPGVAYEIALAAESALTLVEAAPLPMELTESAFIDYRYGFLLRRPAQATALQHGEAEQFEQGGTVVITTTGTSAVAALAVDVPGGIRENTMQGFAEAMAELVGATWEGGPPSVDQRMEPGGATVTRRWSLVGWEIVGREYVRASTHYLVAAIAADATGAEELLALFALLR